MASKKERIWLEEYLKCWNATEAARRAGYKWPNKWGPTKVKKFEKEIADRLKEKAMGTDEVLSRLADMARADMSDFLKTDVPGGLLDLSAIERKGHLIKEIQWTDKGLKFKLHDSQAALVHIGKHLGLFIDRVKVEDWRTDALEQGYDPDAIYPGLVQQWLSHMDGEGDSGGVQGGEAAAEDSDAQIESSRAAQRGAETGD